MPLKRTVTLWAQLIQKMLMQAQSALNSHFHLWVKTPLMVLTPSKPPSVKLLSSLLKTKSLANNEYKLRIKKLGIDPAFFYLLALHSDYL